MGTGTTRTPAWAAAVMAPQYVGDSISSGCPEDTRARKMELQAALAPGQHDDVARGGWGHAERAGGAEFLREPGLQLGQTRNRGSRQRGVAAHGPGQGRAHEATGKELRVGVARVEGDDVVRDGAHRRGDSLDPGLRRAEGCGLPAVVRGSGRAHGPHERPDARVGSR